MVKNSHIVVKETAIRTTAKPGGKDGEAWHRPLARQKDSLWHTN